MHYAFTGLGGARNYSGDHAGDASDSFQLLSPSEYFSNLPIRLMERSEPSQDAPRRKKIFMDWSSVCSFKWKFGDF